MPELRLEVPTPSATFADAAKRWQASRVDVATSTAVQHRTALNRVLPILSTRPVDEIAAADVADLVAKLAEQGKARESIRKSVTALARVLDHAGVTPNPARDRVTVKLPREEPEEFNPPTAEHVEKVFRRIPHSTGSCCSSSTGAAPALRPSITPSSVTTTSRVDVFGYGPRRRRRDARYGSSFRRPVRLDGCEPRPRWSLASRPACSELKEGDTLLSRHGKKAPTEAQP
jgi:hypothetical protein